MVKTAKRGVGLLYYMEYPSVLGPIVLTCQDTGLTGLWLGRTPPVGAMAAQTHPILCQTCAWLDNYFAGENIPSRIPLELEGSTFQKSVWNLLREIPWGSVITYGDIAREIERQTGKRMSAQAVGGAVGRNPVGILIPCHRVVGAKGKLTGYAWGLDKKLWLLKHEGWKGWEAYDHK